MKALIGGPAHSWPCVSPMHRPRARIPAAVRRGRLSVILLGMLVSVTMITAQAQGALTYITPGAWFETAVLIIPGTYASAQPFHASHFFKLLLSRGTILAAMLQPNPEGDADLYLYDTFRKSVANSTTAEQGATETAQYVAQVTGYHYIEVRFVSGRSDYTVTVDESTIGVVAASWGTAVSPVDAAPGDLGVPLTVEVRNENNFTITDVTATLHLGEAFANASGGNLAVAHHSLQVQPGQSFGLTFTLSINSSTPLGVHLLPMTMGHYSISTSTSTTTTSTTSTPSKTETSTASTSTPSTSTSVTPSLPFNLTVPVRLPGRAAFQFALSDLFIRPGFSTALLLKVRNQGTAAVGPSELTLTLPPPLALPGGGGRWSVGALSPGEEATVPISLYAPSSTQGSTFQVAAALTYRSAMGLSRTETQTLAVSVLTASDIQFTVLAEGGRLTAGDFSNVTMTVVNNGTATAYGVDLTLTLSPPLTLAGKDNRWFASSLDPGQGFSFQAAVWAPYGAQGQSFTAAVSIGYRTPEGVAKTDLRGGIGLIVSSAAETEPILSTSLDNADLLAGQVNEVSITVSNDGLSPATALLVTLTTPPGVTIVGRNNRWFVPKVEAGGKVVLPARLFVSSGGVGADSPATVTLSYRDSRSNDITETSSIGFTARGYIDLYVMNIVTSPSLAVAGRSLIVSGSLLNEGSITAKAVNISLAPSPDGVFIATVGSSNFVGEAPVGLQTPFSINLLVASGVTNGTYSLPLHVSFKNDRNELRQVSATVPIAVVEEAPSQPETPAGARPYGLLTIAFVAAAFSALGFVLGVLLQRRRRGSAREQTVA